MLILVGVSILGGNILLSSCIRVTLETLMNMTLWIGEKIVLGNYITFVGYKAMLLYENFLGYFPILLFLLHLVWKSNFTYIFMFV